MDIIDTRILDLLHKAHTIAEIAEEVNLASTRSVYYRMQKLRERGFLLSGADLGRRGKSRSWRLTEKGLGFLDKRGMLHERQASPTV